MTRHDGGWGVFSYCSITQSPLGKHKSFFGGPLSWLTACPYLEQVVEVKGLIVRGVKHYRLFLFCKWVFLLFCFYYIPVICALCVYKELWKSLSLSDETTWVMQAPAQDVDWCFPPLADSGDGEPATDGDDSKVAVKSRVCSISLLHVKGQLHNRLDTAVMKVNEHLYLSVIKRSAEYRTLWR